MRQPHTSAGRVPTDLGYRCYVDQLLAERRSSRPAPQVEARLRRAGHRRRPADARLAGGRRARRTRSASRSRPRRTAPRSSTSTSSRSTAARSWSSSSPTGGHISHKVIEPSEPYRTDRAAAGGQLPERASSRGGRSSTSARRSLERLREERSALRRADGARAAAGEHDVRRHGLGAGRLHPGHVAAARRHRRRERPDVTLETLRTLLRMIEEKTRLVQLLDDYMNGRRPDDRDRHRSTTRRTCSASASSRRPIPTAAAPARSASSARPACGTRARSPPSTALSKAISRMVNATLDSAAHETNTDGRQSTRTRYRQH